MGDSSAIVSQLLIQRIGFHGMVRSITGHVLEIWDLYSRPTGSVTMGTRLLCFASPAGDADSCCSLGANPCSSARVLMFVECVLRASCFQCFILVESLQRSFQLGITAYFTLGATRAPGG